MKKLIPILLLVTLCGTVWSQNSKRDVRKNTMVKEYKQKAGSKTSELDCTTTYDVLGRKTEVIDYASYGQKDRTVYEYEGNTSRVSREIEYDDKNHVKRIRKYEYNANGTRHAQYTYKPDGKLSSTRTYEYIAQ